MTGRIRESYFLAVKTILVLISELYLMIHQFGQAGASGGMFLLLALFLGIFVGEAISKNKWKAVWCSLLLPGVFFLVQMYGISFLLLGIIGGYETISCLKIYFPKSRNSALVYALPLFLPFIYARDDLFVQEIISFLTGIIYFQNDFIVESYRQQIAESTRCELYLKKSMNRQEHVLREELQKGLLGAENQMLEERARLAQTLHDKLGHNINGSVYQLEAVKVLLDKEPETGRAMIQAVIDQLRTGMDEIRAILRRERPQKYKLAVLQLQRLCEKCKEMGIDAVLVTEGDLSRVSEKYLEIILDNAFEAVSNALKYAHCTKMEIKLVVMTQILRCSISDNGVGCVEIKDGMGIAGMRERIRGVNGILDFSVETGFTINMLLPMQE